MTGEQVRKYIENELGCDPVHEVDALAAAITDMAEEINANERELMELLLNNKPINSLMTHSYGFHTANGRGIINSLKGKYYEYN
jgi:replication initiation and membrane attachment protein DnaB